MRKHVMTLWGLSIVLPSAAAAQPAPRAETRPIPDGFLP
jgi:hypothetical protein